MVRINDSYRNKIVLAGVGIATLMDGDDIFVTANTLIDSSITIGLTLEEVRGGQGNALIGQFGHTSTMSLKLTDALFNLEYIAANTGSAIQKGADVFKNEELTTDSTGKLTLSATAVPFKSGSPTYAYICLASAADKNKRTKALVQADNTITGLTADTAYCVRYMYTNGSASKIEISTNFIPNTYYCLLSGNLYSGDATNPKTGTKVGEVLIKIPRYMLNGNQEIAMTATGAAQTSLEGNALASGGSGCEGNAIYAEIVEVKFDEFWYTEAQGLIIEDSLIESTASAFTVPYTPTVYAWYSNALPKMISNSILTAQESNLSQDQTTKLVFAITAGTTGLSIDASTGAITGTPTAGTATVTVEAQMHNGTPIPGLDASATIILS